MKLDGLLFRTMPINESRQRVPNLSQGNQMRGLLIQDLSLRHVFGMSWFGWQMEHANSKS